MDLDADHDLDAITIGGAWNCVQPRFVRFNDGQCRFQKAPALPSDSSQSLASGDLDGDGDQDVIFGNIDQPAEVWLNETNLSPVS